MLLYGIAKTEIQWLQTIVNAAVRLVGGLGRYDHVTSVLRDMLHWLSIWQCVVFKLAVLAFDVRGVITPLTEVSTTGRLIRASHKDQTWYAQFPSGCAANMELFVHQPSAEIGSGLDSNPTCSSAPTHDFTSENSTIEE